jgi:magnesium transporter
MPTPKPQERLHESLQQVKALLERHRVLESMAHRQEGPKRDLLESLVHRQNLAELHNRLKALHPADLASILESLPSDERALVWNQLEAPQAGEVLLEVSPAVRDFLIGSTDRDRLLAVLSLLDADDLSYLAEAVPPAVLEQVYGLLDAKDRSWLESMVAYPEGSVGQLMSKELLTAREGQTLAEVAEEIRSGQDLPHLADAVFVVDARNVLRGVLPLRQLLIRDPSLRAGEAALADAVAFTPDERARQAAKAFERYDLVSAPVVDGRGKLIGRLTVDVVMDFIRRQSEIEALIRAGLSGEEDLFAPVWTSARNRWVWLAINLVTALLASRVIGMFEDVIGQLVALATLMPIVASIGGNTGNQTVALMIRGLALDRITPTGVKHLFRKELTVSLLNGLVWGTAMGLTALALYRSAALGLVMAAAVLLNLLVAAVTGTAVPLLLQRLGRDPAQGSSVLLTFTTDSMGFFIFLGLASVFLR